MHLSPAQPHSEARACAVPRVADNVDGAPLGRFSKFGSLFGDPFFWGGAPFYFGGLKGDPNLENYAL